jgi:ribonuclease BN (tRNA processing enzyme)
MEDAVNLASRARVKQLSLFHHDPNHDDNTISRMVRDARKLAERDGAGLIVEAAREGQTWQSSAAREPAPAKSHRKKQAVTSS